jgi:hypothetical protein
MTTSCASFERPVAVIRTRVEFVAWTGVTRRNSYPEKCGLNVSSTCGCESVDSGLSALARTPYNVGVSHEVADVRRCVVDCRDCEG